MYLQFTYTSAGSQTVITAGIWWIAGCKYTPHFHDKNERATVMLTLIYHIIKKRKKAFAGNQSISKSNHDN